MADGAVDAALRLVHTHREHLRGEQGLGVREAGREGRKGGCPSSEQIASGSFALIREIEPKSRRQLGSGPWGYPLIHTHLCQSEVCHLGDDAAALGVLPLGRLLKEHVLRL